MCNSLVWNAVGITMSLLLMAIINLLALRAGYKNIHSEEIVRAKPFVEGINFHLYHKENLESYEELFVDEPFSLKISQFNSKKPTKLIIHGWTDDEESPWLKEMCEVMALKNYWNIILVDWAPLSHSSFPDAYDHTKLVGEKLGNFTIFLVKSGNISFNSVHYIGHGLGALAAGHAAKNIQAETKKSISRITALDPTINLRIKLFRTKTVLKRDCAKFVDVIHTNGGEYGAMEPLGHVDYYPNGGKQQPGCSSSICNHIRACEYWTASIINAHAFKAYNFRFWDDYMDGKLDKLTPQPMGLVANPTIPSGPYFLETTDEPPHVYTKHHLIR